MVFHANATPSREAGVEGVARPSSPVFQDEIEGEMEQMRMALE